MEDTKSMVLVLGGTGLLGRNTKDVVDLLLSTADDSQGDIGYFTSTLEEK